MAMQKQTDKEISKAVSEKQLLLYTVLHLFIYFLMHILLQESEINKFKNFMEAKPN